MNVRRLWFTFEGSFKHLLSRDIFSSVKLDHTSVVKRVSISWKHAFSTQSGF